MLGVQQPSATHDPLSYDLSAEFTKPTGLYVLATDPDSIAFRDPGPPKIVP
jgi:hypothetical protein